MRASVTVVLLAFSIVGWGVPSTIFAQPALERLEQQIRQRVGTPESRTTIPDHPPPAPPRKAKQAGENTEPGYLGLVADDQKDRGRGVRILEVSRGSPAEKAGLRRQDLITAVAGIRLRQMSDLSEILETFGPGQVVEFAILRDGQSRKVRVALEKRPSTADPGPALPETVPLPPGETIPAPPEPQIAGPRLEPSRTIDRPPTTSRIEQLEHRVDELERRVEELQRAQKAPKKE